MTPLSARGLIRISRMLRVCCMAGAVGIPLLLAFLWWQLDWIAAASPDLSRIAFDPREVNGAQRAAAFLTSMIPAGVLIWGLLRLQAVFRRFATGEFFSAATTDGLRAFALAVTLQALLRPVASALLSVLLTLQNPPGQRSLAVGFGSAELETLFVGAVFLAVAHLMNEGCRLADDNAQFV
ncbi:MAG: DUF2975 domain-containing protein [Alphaproteobacteria bacterium]|nr:DUF2975 domain-containing protein [Alphaproteobacteria bacterium]